MGQPDIGELFPDSDPAYQGHRQLRSCWARSRNCWTRKDFEILNLDCVVVIEAPKIAPFKNEIRKNISRILGIPQADFNLKAKTKEKLDAVGRGEALECFSMAMIRCQDGRMSAMPLITIVGVPNTGKSTLFNRILGKRKALVHNLPGMTRDIFRQKVEINGYWVDLQDSGGFFPDKEIITAEINKKIFKAAENSDLIIFLFDGKRELLGYEKDLYLQIKKDAQDDHPGHQQGRQAGPVCLPPHPIMS